MRLPAEWEPQSAIMLTWPHADSDWAENLEAVESVYQHIVATLLPRQAVLIVCQSAAHRIHVARQCPPGDRLHLAIAPSNDSWTRDHGPITVVDNGKPILLDFDFNGWGGKYPADLDNGITRALYRAGVWLGAERRTPGMVLEGGALETDGIGTLLATRSSIITASRGNSDPRRVEARLRELLGIQRFLWLDHGQLSGDDTDGHIDTLARFVDPGHILHVSCRTDDPDHARIQAMIAELRALRDADGQAYRLTALPAPPVVCDNDGRRLAASYANFLIANQQVLAPVYALDSDQAALDTLSHCFPDREIVAIGCRALIEQNGSLHCASMQLPTSLTLNPDT